MPQLQLHQLRVAAVAKTITDAFEGALDARSIITAALFHDMGNIIKSNFDQFPDSFRGSQSRAYWEEVKTDYIARYGSHEHAANLAIALELGLSDQVRGYIDGVSFSKLEYTRDRGSFEEKITEYSDLRVGPYGVLSLEDRILEAHARYRGHTHQGVPDTEERFAELKQAAHDIEWQIFETVAIAPEDITDASTAVLVEELSEYQVL
jgi:predicted HD phosphohydrolase